MTLEYSIGVVTYLGRYKSYFKPLIRNLHFIFPDRDINVWINGHYDSVRQIQYLKQITSFLATYPNIRYLTNLDHHPLASGFNRLILMSKCDNILILNDDIKIYFNFRHNLETIESPPEIFTFNGTWSHFVISTNIVKKVGWFDERFLGIGYEDTDYALRLALTGIPLGDVRIHGLHDCSAPPDDASWAQISDITLGKYSQINRDFFQRKWGIPENEHISEQDFLKIKAVGHAWLIRPAPDLAEVPEFYPLSCLENSKVLVSRVLDGRIWVRANLAIICSYVNSLYWRARLVLVGWLRHLCGRHWDKWQKAVITRQNNK
jgi:hypothetical protein